MYLEYLRGSDLKRFIHILFPLVAVFVLIVIFFLSLELKEKLPQYHWRAEMDLVD